MAKSVSRHWSLGTALSGSYTSDNVQDRSGIATAPGSFGPHERVTQRYYVVLSLITSRHDMLA